MYNLPCTYGATMLLERDSFLAETQDIILTVLLHLRTDKKKEFCFHPCPKADEASCDVIRKTFHLFLIQGTTFYYDNKKREQTVFYAMRNLLLFSIISTPKCRNPC